MWSFHLEQMNTKKNAHMFLNFLCNQQACFYFFTAIPTKLFKYNGSKETKFRKLCSLYAEIYGRKKHKPALKASIIATSRQVFGCLCYLWTDFNKLAMVR